MGKESEDKKMSSYDNIYIAVSFFAFALFLLAALTFWNGLTTDKMNTDFWDKTEVGSGARDNANVVYTNLDTIATIAYIALHLGVLVMAFALRSHPFVYVAGIFITLVLVLLAAPLSNAYESVYTSNSDLTTASESLPKVNFIMSMFPTMEMIWGFITAIVLYGMARNEGFI